MLGRNCLKIRPKNSPTDKRGIIMNENLYWIKGRLLYDFVIKLQMLPMLAPKTHVIITTLASFCMYSNMVMSMRKAMVPPPAPASVAILLFRAMKKDPSNICPVKGQL